MSEEKKDTFKDDLMGVVKNIGSKTDEMYEEYLERKKRREEKKQQEEDEDDIFG